MRIAICDDEKIIRQQIRRLVEKQRPGCLIEDYASGEELLFAKQRFDVIFLDIKLGGMNGMDTARKIRENRQDGILIFITAIKEYVFEAFEVAAFHYLLKPIEEKKFWEVFGRAASERKKQREKEYKKLLVKTKNRSFTINKDDILYVESRRRKAEIHLAEASLEVYITMNELERELGGSFYRCHRGYLVNMAYITEYNGESISLKNGATVYLAKEKYRAFVKAYLHYLKNGGVFCV